MTKYIDYWALAIINEPLRSLFAPQTNVSSPIWIIGPQGKYLADPFVIEENEKHYIFCEEWDFNLRRGKLVVIESDDLRVFSPPHVIIEEAYHLSYPFILKYNNDWYCLPEQHQSNKVGLYRAESFPFRWKEDKTMIADFPGIDPTVFYKDGLWWMFVGRLVNSWREPADTIHLFYSEDFKGPWFSHPRNPVIIRPFMARSAGRVITYDGVLIRPVQDSSQSYGGGLLFYEISVLSTTEYEEKRIGSWKSDKSWPFNQGLHHIEKIKNGKAIVIDAKRRLELCNPNSPM